MLTGREGGSIDLEGHVAQLLTGAEEDWQVAAELLARRRLRHALFFAHLSLEKLLKAAVARRLCDLPPRLHNLLRLVELTQLRVPESMHSCLAELNVFNLAGRYPDALPALPTQEQAEAMFSAAEETRRWLKGKL